MSDVLDALAKLDSIPFLGGAISMVVVIIKLVETIKVYRKTCADLSRHCASLLFAISENTQGLEGTITQQAADQVEHTIRKIYERMQGWSQLSFHQSLFRHLSIKDGLDSGFRELAHCSTIFNIRSNIDQVRSLGLQNQDHMDLRDMLQHLTENLVDLKRAVQQNRSDVPALMESVQMELKLPDLEARQEQDFRRMLWELHSETQELPPLSDLSGQIGDISPHAVVLGGSSDIHTGMLWDREKVALKRHRAFNCSTYAKKKIVQEVEIWRRLQHQHILPLFGVIFFGGHVSMVSPWMENGNINKFLLNNPKESKLVFLLEISKGLFYLHEQKIIHGDLRGTNILISDDRRAKIADFGLSKAWEEIEEGSHMTTAPGSVRWSARELVQSDDSDTVLSTATDSWSFGMLSLEILTGEQPFAHIHRDVKVYSALSTGTLPIRPDRLAVPELTNDLWDFFLKCWSADPRKRPAMNVARILLAELARSGPGTEQHIASTNAPSAYASSGRRLSEASAHQGESHISRRRPSEASTSHGEPTFSVSAPSIASSGRKLSEGYNHVPYAPSLQSEASSSRYTRYSFSPPRTDTSPATTFTTSNPNATPKMRNTSPSINATTPYTPNTTKPSSYSRDSTYNSPPELRLTSPFHSPPDPISLASRDDSLSPEIPHIRVATPLMDQRPSISTSDEIGPLDPVTSPPTKKPSSITWIGRPMAPNSLLPQSYSQDRSYSRSPAPNAPLRPQDILRVTIEDPEDDVINGEDLNQMSFNPYSVYSPNDGPPPLPPKHEARRLAAPTRESSGTLYSSPEQMPMALPPAPESAISDSSQDGGGSGSGSAGRRPSIWNRITRRGTKAEGSHAAPSPVFGIPLDLMLVHAGTSVHIMLRGKQASDVTVPTLVTKCGYWLKKHGLHEIGLFHRDLPSVRPARRLRAEFERPPDYGKNLDMTGRYSAAVAACVLREFLTELPEPVIPLVFYDHFSFVLDDKPVREIAIERIEDALKAMPSSSRELLLYMCDLIVTFAKHAPQTVWRPSGPEQPTNMMSLRDLVATFKPVLLFHPERDYIDGENRRGRRVLEFLVENLKRILDDRFLWH